MSAVPETPTTGGARRPDYQFVSVARLLATAAVVAIHVSGVFLQSGAQHKESDVLFAGVVVNALTRWSVPLFVVVSGFLALDPARAHHSTGYYRRRVRRIGVPLVCWSVLYVYFDWALREQRLPPVRAFWTTFLLGQPYYHLYFLFIIAGLVVVTPMLRAFADAATPRMLAAAVLATLLLGSAAKMIQLAYGQDPYNAVTLFVPYLGYYLFGGWLARREDLALRPAWAGFAFAVSVVATVAICWILHHAHPAAPWWLWPIDYLAPTTMVSTVSLTLWLRARWPGAGLAGQRGHVLRWAAGLTFGIYLVHPALLATGRTVWHAPAWAGINADHVALTLGWQVLTWVVVLAVSALFVAVLRRVPYVRALL